MGEIREGSSPSIPSNKTRQNMSNNCIPKNKKACDGSGHRVTEWYQERKEGGITRAGMFRCPVCNRRLKVREKRCIGGEFVGFVVPPHISKKK